MTIWAAKIAAKLVIGRMPYRHTILRNIGMFRHGDMDNTAYALGVFKLHIDSAFPDGAPEGLTALELGSGDSLVSALIANAYGMKKIYHVDVGEYASQDIELYKKCSKELKESGLDAPDLSSINSIDEMLKLCNASYLTNGLESLKQIPSQSVDFIWSHSVLEHIRKKDFEATMKELHRIVKKTGFVSHNVDLKDHLDKSLNNLRFSDKFWENDLVADSGFYTNRINYSTSLNSMRKSGFDIVDSKTRKWDKLPTPKSKMAKPFQKISEDDLCVHGYKVLLKSA